MTTQESLLVLDHISRRLAGRVVVDDFDLAVSRGEVLGLLGVNGAGKTTVLRMIAGVLAPSSGAVRLDGRDLYEYPELARRRIGYLPEMPPLYDELTTKEFLRFCACLRGVARSAVAAAVERAVDRCELGEVRRRPLGLLSKGFRQRVGLAQAILHDPELIVLDEPASGLDPVQAMKLRALIRRLGADHAVILSTHVLPDVSACCDRVAILHGGVLRHVGAIHAQGEDATLHVGVVQPMQAQDWASLPQVTSVEPIDATHWRVHLAAGATGSALVTALVERGFGVDDLQAESAALERLFLAIAAGPTVQVA
ncbi:MAG: ABC transporter ATP-binding protein [Rhodanobacter sp.]|nr:ABC transporter ATP-binding protein [Rhodanobacter sp.]